MSKITELLLNCFLISAVALILVAIVILISKNFNRVGYRTADRIWQKIDDLDSDQNTQADIIEALEEWAESIDERPGIRPYIRTIDRSEDS